MAQFPPPVGQPGTTAIHADSSVFIAWATGCTLQRGPMDISDPGAGLASVGDESAALGVAGTNGVVSLGDGGIAVLTFARPMTNGPGWDFAVFENSFSDTYLELAFVEVSSNGNDFFRFPATSNTPTETQIDGFGVIDATHIDNLAGKYRALYGTPFDLDQLADEPGLDVNAITHVRIVDVVGCIQDAYATYDHLGRKVNDPWNTPFASSGFDLDAVGVIHQLITADIGQPTAEQVHVRLFPNPAEEWSRLRYTLERPGHVRISIHDAAGRTLDHVLDRARPAGAHEQLLDLRGLPASPYIVTITTGQGLVVRQLIVR